MARATRNRQVTSDCAEIPSLEPVQLLSPDGVFSEDERFPLKLSVEDQLLMYEWMILTRTLDQEFINLQRQGELALYPSCHGQEAAQVGSAYALSDEDWLFPQYRELGVFVVRGIDPAGVAQMWRGTRHGGVGLFERNCAPISIPIGTHALHAVGAAVGSSLLETKGIAVAYIGDGATSEGDVHEAFNFAAVYAAPCLFFVQNNQWAISVPLSEQTKSPSIAHKAIAYGMPGIRCDGNDVLACYAVTRSAAERAMSGGGPTLIEAVTYRMEAHTTSDDATRYRSAEEVEAWSRLDPIERLQAYLRREGWLTDARETDIQKKAREAALQLRADVVDAADPGSDEIFVHAFAEPTPALLRQAEELGREISLLEE